MEPQERADRWPKSLPKKTLTQSLPSLKELAFHHFQQRALLQSFNCLQLSKVIQDVAIQLQGEAGPMAGILPVHQNLMDFLHHLLRRNLKKVRTQTIIVYSSTCSCQTSSLSCNIRNPSDFSLQAWKGRLYLPSQEDHFCSCWEGTVTSGRVSHPSSTPQGLARRDVTARHCTKHLAWDRGDRGQ